MPRETRGSGNGGRRKQVCPKIVPGFWLPKSEADCPAAAELSIGRIHNELLTMKVNRRVLTELTLTRSTMPIFQSSPRAAGEEFLGYTVYLSFVHEGKRQAFLLKHTRSARSNGLAQ